jgi:outer membrane receptor protein involved in Fe transport
MWTIASADEPSAVELEHVLVTPRRIPGLFVDVSTFPGNATVITASDIAQSSATTIQEVLARAEGVFLADAQGFGLNSDSTLNLRGMVNSSRTGALVVMDGVRQNRFTGDEVHWQSLPLAGSPRRTVATEFAAAGDSCTAKAPSPASSTSSRKKGESGSSKRKRQLKSAPLAGRSTPSPPAAAHRD